MKKRIQGAEGSRIQVKGKEVRTPEYLNLFHIINVSLVH